MLNECATCATRYALDLGKCPHCGAEVGAPVVPPLTTTEAILASVTAPEVTN